MRRQLLVWTVALAALGAAVGGRWLLEPLLGGSLPLVTLFAAVAVAAWVGGWGPALMVAALGYLACAYLFMEPRGFIWRSDAESLVALAAYAFTCFLIIAIGEALREARQRAADGEELLRVTLGGIGDGVIATDTLARVVYLNGVAESLIGWKLGDALGRPLADVFRIRQAEAREPVENPAELAVRDRTVIGPTHHTLLPWKEGVERVIEDRAAPLRNKSGEIVGCVITFRDVTGTRPAQKARGA